MNNLRSSVAILLVCTVAGIFVPNRGYSQSDDVVTVRDNSELSLDELGALNAQNGGLPSNIWNHADREFVTTLLATLPDTLPSVSTQILQTRLLMTSAVPPEGKASSKNELFLIRLKKLARSGKTDTVSQMIAMVPPANQTDEILSIQAASLFTGDNAASACDKVQEYLSQYKSAFWRLSSVVCKAYDKKANEIEFALKLLKEDNIEVPANFEAIPADILARDETGKTQWNHWLMENVLALGTPQAHMPALGAARHANFLKEGSGAWTRDIKSKPIAEQLLQASKLYAVMEGLGLEVGRNAWRELIVSALTNQVVPPSYAVYHLLDNTDKTRSDGEALLLILHSLREKETKHIPSYLLARIVHTLDELGLEEDARQLAAEGMNGPAE